MQHRAAPGRPQTQPESPLRLAAKWEARAARRKPPSPRKSTSGCFQGRPSTAPAAASSAADAQSGSRSELPATARELEDRVKDIVGAHAAEKAQAEALRELKRQLTKSLTHLTKLFKKWDHDHSGTVDRGEFQRGVSALVPNTTAETISSLFGEFDEDGSGEITYSECVRHVIREALSLVKKRIG